MPRILHFYKTAFPDSMGGIEQTIHQLARGCVRHGFETDVLSLSSEKHAKPLNIDGYTAHRAHLNFEIASNGFSWQALQKFRALAGKADVIHFHFPWPFMDLIDELVGHGKPVLVTYHSDIVRQKQLLKLYEPLGRRFLNRANRIVATSQNYVDSSTWLQSYKDKVHVIPIGVDADSYPKASDANVSKWRAEYPSSFFLFVGVLRYYKGLQYLIQAMAAQDIPVLIVGAGPQEKELKELARQNNATNIHFLGLLSDEDKVALLTLCKALVIPSHLRSEAYGVSLVEGLMFGKPLICADISTGTSFINQHEKTGLVVPPADSDALRDAMLKLWNDSALAIEFGTNARNRYEQLFTSRKMCESYINQYSTLIA
jgi:O-antigen biosynthesis rhamnosyltransferase